MNLTHAPFPIEAHHITLFPEPVIIIGGIIFTLIAVLLCFAIYFKTKESYELTKYSGIKYFRYAFLFFGLSYILSFLSGLAMFSREIFGFRLSREIFGPIFILPLGYFSTMAILYLIYSSIWKKFDNKKTMIISHIVAIILTTVAFITRSPLILLYLQSILFIMAIISVQFVNKTKHKISQIKILYFIVLGLWLINLLILGRGHPVNPIIEIISQVTSLIAYIFIYYKISKLTNYNS